MCWIFDSKVFVIRGPKETFDYEKHAQITPLVVTIKPWQFGGDGAGRG